MNIGDYSQQIPPKHGHDTRHIPFGKVFSPNMFLCEYRNGHWSNARIEPLVSFELHPAALVFHYGQSIFEGMKAFRQPDGSVSLFRPEMNARRFNRSAERMCMPKVEETLFLDAVAKLSEIEESHVPDQPGSLYLRPVMVGTDSNIGVRASEDFTFYILALPAGAYFPESHGGPGAIRVLISESVVRAARGGTGAVKTAANYAVTLKVIQEAKMRDCSQVLFLDASAERRVEEMGGMNIMFVESGAVVTPALNDTILPGVIRDSLLQISRDLGIPVREYAFSLEELLSKLASGVISEVFACGTAATVTSINKLRTESGRDFHLDAPGPITQKLYDHLVGIQYGHIADKHGWVHTVAQAKSLA